MDISYTEKEPNKIYILGAERTGKTNLIRILAGKQFIEKTKKNLGIFSSQIEIVCGNKKRQFSIKELSDNADYKFLKYFKNEIEDTRLAIVMFALDDIKSLEIAKYLIQFIELSVTNNFMHIILCGNKADLQEKMDDAEIENEIAEMSNIEYIEISCKTEFNIQKIRDIIQNLDIITTEYISIENNDNMSSSINMNKCNLF